MKAPVSICLLVVFAVLSMASSCLALSPTEVDRFKADLSDALLDMGMTTADLRIRHDYADPDVFRLPLIDSLMYNPASLLERMDALAVDVEGTLSAHGKALTIWHAMSVDPANCSVQDPDPVRMTDLTGRVAHLPSSVSHSLEAYLDNLGILTCLREIAISRVEPHLDFLYEELPSMVAPDETYEEVGPFELHMLEKREEALNDSVLAICEEIHVQALSAMSYLAIKSAEDLASHVERSMPFREAYERYNGGRISFEGRVSRVTGPVLYVGRTNLGPVVIGGTSSNTYDGCFALVVDLGGDDIYNLTDQHDVHFRLVVDHEGRDTYRSTDGSAVAGITLGTSIIIDNAGDDTYTDRGNSLGAGICGTGALLDLEGNDTYVSEAFSQGAGFMGLGILHDVEGHDTYTAGMQSQAFGYVMGTGLLLEGGGNDTYFTRMAQTDILRYDDHYLTLSQGCAFGSRPDYSGGIGLLIDSQGNDLYSSDIFGQGVGYWFAVGAIVDRHGHDRYCSYQYAQGAGIHLAFGLLLDEGGDDAYQSKGVSHGCGHDLSLGLLADFSGNDWYTATDLSQGAGNANGTGVLYDADGIDSYACKSTVNVNGYGNYRREFGSIGLHIDKLGKDFYAARGDNEAVWESGMYGLGIDYPGKPTKPRGDLAEKVHPFEKRPFTPEELFILSARGEPRFNRWRKYAFDKMVEDSVSSIAYLRSVLDTKDARERHTIKDILKEIGEPAVPMLSDAALEDSPTARAEASWILGIIGSPAAFDPLLELSHDDTWKLRSSALNAIGKLKDLTDDDRERLETRVEEVATDPDEIFIVNKDAMYAAGKQQLCGTLGYMLETLEHDHYSARFAAAEALQDLSEAPCDGIGRMLLDRVPGMSSVGIVACLHASHELAPATRLDIAEAALERGDIDDVHIGVAVARLLKTIEPDGKSHERRLDDARKRVSEKSWQAASMLE